MNRAEIEAAFATLGRPPVTFGGGFGRIQARIDAARKWDKENPEQAKRFAELVELSVALDEKERLAEEADAFARRVMDGIKAAGVDRAGAAFGKLDDTPALKVARAWWESEVAWLLLLGGVGTGKTVAAVWVFGEAMRQGKTVAFRTAAQLGRLSGFDEGARQMEQLKKVDLLVVDDVGAEASTAWGQGILGELFDARHQGFRRTIITSNLTVDEFKARVGERLADRLREDGQVQRLEGKSLRGRK